MIGVGDYRAFSWNGGEIDFYYHVDSRVVLAIVKRDHPGGRTLREMPTIGIDDSAGLVLAITNYRIVP